MVAKMNCPHCGQSINVGALLGARRSFAKAFAARINGKKGGWPKWKKRGRRSPNATPSATAAKEGGHGN